MQFIAGEHTGKIDAKGRVPLPSQLKKQLGDNDESIQFVLRKCDTKKCLELYPLDVWNELVTRMRRKLKPFVAEHNAFWAQFNRGTLVLGLDSTNRLLIPKGMCDYAGMKKDVVFHVLSGLGYAEVWSKAQYDASAMPQDVYMKLREELLDFNLFE